MAGSGRSTAIALLGIAFAALAAAQETGLGSDFRREGEALGKNCSKLNFGGIGSCLYTLFTDHPMHITAGSTIHSISASA